MIRTFLSLTVGVIVAGTPAQAANVTLEEGPVKSINLDGWTAGARTKGSNSYGQPCIETQTFKKSPGLELVVAVYEVPAAKFSPVFSGSAHTLSASERSALNTFGPWALRYMLERGAPATVVIGSRKVLYNEYGQPEKIMVALPGGRRGCVDEERWDFHALIWSGDRLTQLTLQAGKNSAATAKLELSRILASAH